MKRKIALPLGLLAVCAAGTIGFAPAASADVELKAETFQLFQNNNYGGGTRAFTSGDHELSGNKWDNGDSMQNSASSMKNFRNHYVGLWDKGTSCTGDNYTAKPNSRDSSFGNNGFDNDTSCVKFL
ncbi:hypothetical protein [Streptomyces iconiensis]|uniref:Uncharacterized protein n=1 Tax=Streptomyces iconiensis TaxID=1384038 RepID=A0ABT6ZYM4_9ACTN|nr:hypothetical protein [Streptomyces iconiensis]MDJ1134178.1 hypothetical protein [Streptomyces iconiensis]